MKPRPFLRFAALVAVYLVVALPFKAMSLVPGFTDVRPVTALQPIYGVFFGLAGCLAVACGNLISDIADDALRWSSIAGFAANFLAPLLSWWFWTRFSRTPFSLRSARDLMRQTLVLVVSGAMQATVITPAVALVYPEVDAVFFAKAVLANSTAFPVFFGIPLAILLQEELGFRPLPPHPFGKMTGQSTTQCAKTLYP